MTPNLAMVMGREVQLETAADGGHLSYTETKQF
jgi:hypothetical protein